MMVQASLASVACAASDAQQLCDIGIDKCKEVFELQRLLLHGACILCKLGMCVIVANIMEQCSLFLLLQRGAGPMALMLWLDWVT
jgi:hypothetical protein